MSGFDNQGVALGEVYGVRWWNVVERGYVPVLTGMRGDWEPGENVAECRAGHHCGKPAPQDGCGCGFWAYWTPEAAPVPPGRRVLGVVKGYGDTLIGDQGCRCQLARIVALSFEKVATMPGPGQYVQSSGPPPGVRWQAAGNAEATYRALGGSPRGEWLYEATTVDDLVTQAQDEMRLAARYGVPVYATPAAMLALHPLTTEYRPKPATEDQVKEWAGILARWCGDMSDAITSALTPHVISGADALRQLNARMGMPLDGDTGPDTVEAQRLANE